MQIRGLKPTSTILQSLRDALVSFPVAERPTNVDVD